MHKYPMVLTNYNASGVKYSQKEIEAPGNTSSPYVWSDTLIKSPKAIVLDNAMHSMYNTTVLWS